jgi:hypothetical protein
MMERDHYGTYVLFCCSESYAGLGGFRGLGQATRVSLDSLVVLKYGTAQYVCASLASAHASWRACMSGDVSVHRSTLRFFDFPLLANSGKAFV